MTADPSPYAALVLMLAALTEAQREALFRALKPTAPTLPKGPTRRKRAALPEDRSTLNLSVIEHYETSSADRTLPPRSVRFAELAVRCAAWVLGAREHGAGS